MRVLAPLKRPMWAIVVGGTLIAATAAHAQVEALNPNPTLPAGIGSAGELEGFHHGSMEGTRIGRGSGDKNPADIMLRDIGGTNRGRRTGRAAIRGGAVRAALQVEGVTRASPLGERGAVYFAHRGDYENAIYSPSRGSYRTRVPSRPAPAARNTR